MEMASHKSSVSNNCYIVTGFPAAAAYAAYAGRGYTGYPGFGLPGGIAGYPTGNYSLYLHVINNSKIHLSNIKITFTKLKYIDSMCIIITACFKIRVTYFDKFLYSLQI